MGKSIAWGMGMGFVFMLEIMSACQAGPPRYVTDTGLIAGSWQSESQRLTLICLPSGRAIMELDVQADRGTRLGVGSYQPIRPGVWRLEVTEPDYTRHVFFLTFEDPHRLVVNEGASRTFRMYRAGRSFDELDRDNDGYISREEAKGSPLAFHFEEFGGGERRMIDRAAYERFLSKYPHRGSAK
ncbi:MAG: EF-hand domain-containing protein [Gemmatales bacterium]|nr:EF-hand domain-containing protein [Gemmatales bacterium]MDW8387879.1 EF-hand domain-containing protein [Gemmatales bacterium]